MNLIQAIIIIVSMYAALAAIWGFIIFHYHRCNILIKLTTKELGAHVLKSKRYRLSKKGNLYGVFDLFGRKPIKINDVHKYMMIAEGWPVVGVKKIIRAQMVAGKITPTPQPNVINITPEIKDTVMAWMIGNRRDQYQNTKFDMTRQEMIAKIYLPTILIVLAVAMLIFFPRIYETILQHGDAPISGFKSAIGGFIDQFRPAG